MHLLSLNDGFCANPQFSALTFLIEWRSAYLFLIKIPVFDSILKSLLFRSHCLFYFYSVNSLFEIGLSSSL